MQRQEQRRACGRWPRGQGKWGTTVSTKYLGLGDAKAWSPMAGSPGLGEGTLIFTSGDKLTQSGFAQRRQKLGSSRGVLQPAGSQRPTESSGAATPLGGTGTVALPSPLPRRLPLLPCNLLPSCPPSPPAPYLVHMVQPSIPEVTAVMEARLPASTMAGPSGSSPVRQMTGGWGFPLPRAVHCPLPCLPLTWRQ